MVTALSRCYPNQNAEAVKRALDKEYPMLGKRIGQISLEFRSSAVIMDGCDGQPAISFVIYNFAETYKNLQQFNNIPQCDASLNSANIH